MSFLDRLKEELEESADWSVTVTVSRRDLEQLITEYEQLKRDI